MFFVKKPSPPRINQFIADQKSQEFSYSQIGVTKDGNCAPGYGKDKVRGQLGKGINTFQSAVKAFRNWQQFKVGWVEIYPSDAAVETNQVVAVLAWHGLFWSLNACRIIYVINDNGQINRFGFGYGTLPDHAETGEERFLLEWDKNTDIVSYEILAFSNPHHWLTWLGLPITRIVQNKFRRDSLKLIKESLQDIPLD